MEGISPEKVAQVLTDWTNLLIEANEVPVVLISIGPNGQYRTTNIQEIPGEAIKHALRAVLSGFDESELEIHTHEPKN